MAFVKTRALQTAPALSCICSWLVAFVRKLFLERDNEDDQYIRRARDGRYEIKLFQITVDVLEADGWKVERVAGSGKSSAWRITKGSESKIISIRTTQDTWIAFPRAEGDESWRTLDEVDAVVSLSPETDVSTSDKEHGSGSIVRSSEGTHLLISEAKLRLAATF